MTTASTNLIERHFIVARKAMPEAQSALARTEPEVDASQVIAESIFPEDDALNTEAETVPPPEDEGEEAVSDTSSVEEVESVSTSDQARAEVTAQLEAVANFPFNADLTLLAEDLKRLNGILADQAAQVTQLREAGTITSSEASEFQREIRGLQEALDVTAESDNFTGKYIFPYLLIFFISLFCFVKNNNNDNIKMLVLC